MSHYGRMTLGWMVFAALLVLLLILCIQGCAPVTVPPPSLESASTRLDVIKAEAEFIVREAEAGAAKWTDPGHPFGTIAESGRKIVTQAGEARGEVGQGQKQIAAALQKIDQLQSEQNKMLDLIRFLGVCAIPAAVFFALQFRMYSTSVALAVAGLAAIATASVVGKLAGVWPWVGGAMALAIIYLAVETAWRMKRDGLGFRDALMLAIRTPPWNDIAAMFPQRIPPGAQPEVTP